MSDDAPKPPRSPEDERRRRITGLSFAETARLLAQAHIGWDFVMDLRAVCAKAVQDGCVIEPASLLAAIDGMIEPETGGASTGEV